MRTRDATRLTRRGWIVVSLVLVAVVAGGAWSFLGAGVDLEVPVEAEAGATAVPSSDGATPTQDASPTEASRPPRPLLLADAGEGLEALGADPGTAVVAALEATVAHAPVVVVAAADVLGPARGVAWRVGAPLLPLDVDGLEELLDRLRTETVVFVQSHQDPDAASTSPTRDLDGPAFGDREVRPVTVDGTEVDREAVGDLESPPEPEGAAPLLLVADGDPARPLLDVLAMATDARIVPVDGALGASPTAITTLRSVAERSWVVAGTSRAWGDTDLDLLRWDVEVARSGVELPGGGLRLFPGRRLVALYGSPGAASLGVLGEQAVEPAIDRARALAAQYAPLVDEPVVPTFEIITTVASGGAESTGDYSRRVPLEQIEPWVDAAEEAGIYVILDLQPGRTDFLTQAREVESLLRRPHVGLALDPEWRLGPDQVHLTQIGSVEVDEVQAVADWLAELTRREALPQKLLLLHQFRLSMLPDRDQLQVPPELAIAIQMDGQGGQGAKDATWQSITTIDPPEDVWFGWKNFYDEDVTLRSPADTLAVEPSPVLVSYQ